MQLRHLPDGLTPLLVRGVVDFGRQSAMVGKVGEDDRVGALRVEHHSCAVRLADDHGHALAVWVKFEHVEHFKGQEVTGGSRDGALVGGACDEGVTIGTSSLGRGRGGRGRGSRDGEGKEGEGERERLLMTCAVDCTVMVNKCTLCIFLRSTCYNIIG